METAAAPPLIVAWDRLDNGLVLSFTNGRSAFYSDALLYSIIDSSDEIRVLEAED